MIGIVIATYPRPDGKTPFFLNRALKSIEEQIYKDYKVFIIGDGYPGDELTGIISKYSKIVCFNLSYSVERVKYNFKKGKENAYILHKSNDFFITEGNTFGFFN